MLNPFEPDPYDDHAQAIHDRHFKDLDQWRNDLTDPEPAGYDNEIFEEWAKQADSHQWEPEHPPAPPRWILLGATIALPAGIIIGRYI